MTADRGASSDPASVASAYGFVTGHKICPDCHPDDPAARDADRCATHRDDDLIPRAEVVRVLRDLAIGWGREMSNEIVGSALMDAASYFEGEVKGKFQHPDAEEARSAMIEYPDPEQTARRLRELAAHEDDPEVRRALLGDADYVKAAADRSGPFRKCACVCGCSEEQAPRSWTCVSCRASECSRP